MRVVIELKRGEVAEIVLNNLYAQTPMETVFGINMVALHGRPAEAARPQGDARGLRAPSARGRHAPHDFRPRARRASAPTSSKAWRSRSPTSTRSSRSSRRRRRRPRRKAALLARAWAVGRRAADAGARGRDFHAAGRTSPRSSACMADGLPAVRGAGAGDPRHAPAPPHRARAGQDRRRVPGAAGADPRPRPTSWRARSASRR